MSLGVKRKEGTKKVIVRAYTGADYDIPYDTTKSYDVIAYASRRIIDFLKKVAELARKAGFNANVYVDYENMLADLEVEGRSEEFEKWFAENPEVGKLWDKVIDDIKEFMKKNGITGAVEDFSADYYELGITIINPNSASAVYIQLAEYPVEDDTEYVHLDRRVTVIEPEAPVSKEMLEEIANELIFNYEPGEYKYEVSEGPEGLEIKEIK